MCMMSFYDLIQGEGDVQKYTASYQSVLFTLLIHMTNIYFAWPWLVWTGHMT